MVTTPEVAVMLGEFGAKLIVIDTIPEDPVVVVVHEIITQLLSLLNVPHPCNCLEKSVPLLNLRHFPHIHHPFWRTHLHLSLIHI